MTDAYISDGTRTPFGRFAGALSGVRTDDLAAHPIRALMARFPDLPWEQVDDVIYGDANQAGEDNRNIARMASWLAGLPVAVPRMQGIGVACGALGVAACFFDAPVESPDGDAAPARHGRVACVARAAGRVAQPHAPQPRARVPPPAECAGAVGLRGGGRGAGGSTAVDGHERRAPGRSQAHGAARLHRRWRAPKHRRRSECELGRLRAAQCHTVRSWRLKAKGGARSGAREGEARRQGGQGA